MEALSRQRIHIVWREPSDELAGMARVVRDVLKRGDDLEVRDVCIAVPNRAWLHAARAALQDLGIESVAVAACLGESAPVLSRAGARGVTLGSYGQISSLNPRVVLALGLVEGMMPSFGGDGAHDDSDARVEAQRLAFRDAVGGPREEVYLSSFTRMEPDLAGKCGASIVRIRRDRGAQLAVVERSRFIDELGDESPRLVSGEQFAGMATA